MVNIVLHTTDIVFVFECKWSKTNLVERTAAARPTLSDTPPAPHSTAHIAVVYTCSVETRVALHVSPAQACTQAVQLDWAWETKSGTVSCSCCTAVHTLEDGTGESED